jgi:hypothetical protein
MDGLRATVDGELLKKPRIYVRSFKRLQKVRKHSVKKSFLHSILVNGGRPNGERKDLAHSEARGACPLIILVGLVCLDCDPEELKLPPEA